MQKVELKKKNSARIDEKKKHFTPATSVYLVYKLSLRKT